MTTTHKTRAYRNVSESYQHALAGALDSESLQDMSIPSRCALIRRILDMKSTGQRPAGGKSDMLGASLKRLSKCFEISANLKAWQRQRRHLLARQLTCTENKTILKGFRNWGSMDTAEQQNVLKQSVDLHVSTYLNGSLSLLPYAYDFEEGAMRSTSYGVSYTFGSFCGDIKTGAARITQYTDLGRMLLCPREAFETAHHEATHLIQHNLAVAYHRNQISMAHPLYKDAIYFHSVDLRKSHIPVSEYEAYRSQPHEVLADMEGSHISSIIESLAY